MSNVNYDKYSGMARAIVAEGNDLLSLHCSIRSDSYDPVNRLATSDHAQGFAYDINAASPADLVYFYLFICSHFPELQEKYGLRKAFLSAHNRHVHLSFNPSASPLLGLETITGDGRTNGKFDPAKFPIVHLSGLDALMSELYNRPAVLQMYGVSAPDIRTVASRLGSGQQSASVSLLMFLAVLGIVVAAQGGNNG